MKQPTEVSVSDALALRMTSLLLRPNPSVGPRGRPVDVAGIVAWFGAMQSQDAASGLWSLGVRLPGWTSADVLSALERKEALRTWPMRGTVHLIPSRDARWMLDVLGEPALRGAAARRQFLGLDDKTADRAVEVLGKALAGGGRLTRSQCLEVLSEAGIAAPGQFGYHLLWYASQRGVTCMAPNIGKEASFVLLDEWAPDQVRLDRDEALATIARRYFRSHGPTTRQDFAGWIGLGATDAKLGIAAAGEALASIKVEGRELYLAPEVLDADRSNASSPSELHVLPGFDEFLLGYKDRSWMVAPEHKQAIIPGGNGVFQATVVRDGKVIATWKRRSTVRKTVVTVFPLITLKPANRKLVEAAFEPYGHFLAMPLEVVWS